MNPTPEIRGAHAPRGWWNAPSRSALRAALCLRRAGNMFVRFRFFHECAEQSDQGGRAPWRTALFVATACCVLLRARASGAVLAGPFENDFSALQSDGLWSNHLAAGNSVESTDGALRIRATGNSPAHIEREFGVDFIRVTCALQADRPTTPALLTLRWGEESFLQFGLNAPVVGKLNVREVLGTYPHDYELDPVSIGDWQHVRIELARDCIRYLASKDSKSFATIHISPRPERFIGPPKWITLGRDSGGKMFTRPSPWLVEPTLLPGVSEARDLRVEMLPKTALNATAAECRNLAQRERDLAGEQELAAKGDPTFESVSRHFPAIKWSREVVGVKDHPHDIGVAPDGSLQLNDNLATFKGPTAHFEINGQRFGSRDVSCAKSLHQGWMPIVTTRDSHDGLQLDQTVFGWTKDFSPDEPLLGYVQFRATNPGEVARAIEVRLGFNIATNSPAPLSWTLNVPARGCEAIAVRVPFKIVESPATQVSADEFQTRLGEAAAYWDKLIAGGSRFEIPEPRVQSAYRAWLAYNFLNVAKRKGVLHVCDGAGFYDKVYGYSAALYCHGLDLFGYPDLAETYCDALLSFAHTNGLLAVNFGSTDTGTALWVMTEHYRLTRDEVWLRRVAPKMRLMCGWIVNQRHVALANAAKEPAVTRGLIRYKPYADLLHPAADYFSNGYLWKGLDATARVFAEIGLQGEATELRQEADAYFKDIQASMNAAVFRDRGQNILPMIPDTRELWQESNGSANGYYGIIAPCLLEIGLPAATDPKARLITDALELRGGLVAGVSQFHLMGDHAYAYGYWIISLERDDVKRAILGLYGSLAYGMSRDTYAAVECTMIRTGENYWMLPHTYSNTQQLRLLRNLLVREAGDTLWLGQAIPRHWLEAGKRVAVNEAPTTFGPVSYSICASADGSMQVQLSPPSRNAPKEIALRLREPRQRKIARVKASEPVKLNYSRDTIRIAAASKPLTLEVTFR